MLIEAARRAEAAAKEMLAAVNEGSVSCAEIREALAVSKAIAGVNTAFQAAAAAAVAGRERHGDGGTEVLASAAGLSRREAHSQVKTAEALAQAPKLREAVAQGKVSVANARRLAEAVEKTDADAVESDAELLAKAESMRPEDFSREARRWTVKRQRDGGESEHARQRARRRVRVWDSDDGMVHLHGEFDTVTGRRIGNRLRAEAARMHDADKQPGADGSNRRSFDQCMADALDNLTNLTAINSSTGSGGGNASSKGGGKPFADIAVVWHLNADTEKVFAEIAGGDRLPASVLEELMCNCTVTGLIYDTEGVPLWRGHTKRRATPGQMRARSGHEHTAAPAGRTARPEATNTSPERRVTPNAPGRAVTAQPKRAALHPGLADASLPHHGGTAVGSESERLLTPAFGLDGIAGRRRRWWPTGRLCRSTRCRSGL